MNKESKIFLSYTHKDKARVEQLYSMLSEAGFHPWMDKDILPGANWKEELKRTIRTAPIFLACMSKQSINKRGVIQEEIKEALEVWKQKLDDDIYLIPVRLENCEVPEALAKFQWVDLYKENGFEQLLKAIKVGISKIQFEEDNEKAIVMLSDKLLDLLTESENKNNQSLYTRITETLEEVAITPESQYQVGLKLLDRYPQWAIKMLAKSGRKQAIEPLKKMLSYDIGEGPDHNSYVESVAKDASKALDGIVKDDSELQLQVGLAGCESPWIEIEIWAINMLAKSGRKEAIKPLELLVKKLEDRLSYKDSFLNMVYGQKIREAIETARNALMKLLLKVLLRFNRNDTIDDDEVLKTLEEMAIDANSQYDIGFEVLNSNNFRGLSYSGILQWGIKMLGKSGRKDAVELLIKKKLLYYDEYDHPEVALSVVEAAREALNNLVGTDSELQLQVGLEGCDSSWLEINKWAAQMLAKSGREEAIEPLEDMLKRLEYKLENSLKDKILAPSHGPKFREAVEATRKALKDLGAN